MDTNPNDPKPIAEMTDRELLDAYEQTTGAPGDVEADRLADELRRRGTDV